MTPSALPADAPVPPPPPVEDVTDDLINLLEEIEDHYGYPPEDDE